MNIDHELSSPRFRANPYPLYAQLRSRGPVLPAQTSVRLDAAVGRRPTFLLARYEEVYNALRDPRLVSDATSVMERGANSMDRWWIPRVFRTLQNSMVLKDGADHRRLRDLVHKAFTPGMIEALSGRIQQMVTQMLDEAGRRPTGDLIADLALPLPLNVISEMMGVPEKARMEFRKLMVRFTDSVSAGSGVRLLLNLPNGIRLDRFLRRLAKLRREGPGDDLLTALLQAEEAGDRLNEEELNAMIFLLLLAGHETTVNLIGTGTLALLEHPDQLQRLREHPELIDSAVEELLRFTNPVTQLARFATEDLEIQGTRIPRGSALILLVASANRDEAVFANPDTLDIARTPNRHVAFGYGVHYCLGAPLARLEGRIAMLDLVRRFPEMRLAVPREQLRWRKSTALRGMKALPVHLGPQASVRAAAA